MDRAGSGLRRLIGLLLALNVGVLATGLGLNYWAGNALPPVTFNADKIHLLEEARPAAGVTAQAAEPTVPPARAATAGVCLAWSSLDAARLAGLEAHLRAQGVAETDYELQADARLGWWVYIPPMSDAEALRVVMEDARTKGVRDLTPVHNGALRNALALGTFPSLALARRHAQDLAGKGLRGVLYGPRQGAGMIRLVPNNPQSSALRRALQWPWPPGLAPDGCGQE